MYSSNKVRKIRTLKDIYIAATTAKTDTRKMNMKEPTTHNF
jgi:hypothetical protein